MTFEHNIILIKLRGFLTGEISQNEIYEWALFVAVSRDYEELIKDNPLAEHIIQFLVEINSQKAKATPIKKVIEYYIQCLDNQTTFSLEGFNSVVEDKPAIKPAVAPAAVSNKPKVDWAGSKWINQIMKIYVLIFAVLSVLLNLIVLIKPNFLLSQGQVPPAFEGVLRAAIPHLLYGSIIIYAMMFKSSRSIFYGLFFVAALGMFYYWYLATDYVMRQGQPMLNLVPILPFVALPPTAGFFVMLNQWFDSPHTTTTVSKTSET